MTLASQTTLITLQYRLVPTSDPMMLILLILVGIPVITFIIKWALAIVVLIISFCAYAIQGRVSEYNDKMKNDPYFLGWDKEGKFHW